MIEISLKEGWKLSNNSDKIIRMIERNDGFCPCGNRPKIEDNKCPCKDYRENNYCKCNLYIKD